MPCNHPFYGFETGFLTESGKKDFVLTTSGTVKVMDAQHSKKPLNIPLLISSGKAVLKGDHVYLIDPIPIPCGSCIGCRTDRSREWKIRNCMEIPYHAFNYFVTFTYDDDHLPFNEFGEPVLLLKDMQDFWKRLRKKYQVSYFMCGEYGENTLRPHYHALIYSDKDFPGFSLWSPYKYLNETLQNIWKNGQVIVEDVQPGSVAYVSGYVEKKLKDSNYELYPVKPFTLMSRRPAIGFRYIRDHYRSIVETHKVYGRFGEDPSNAHATIPRSVLRKFEGSPWLEDYKALAKLAGEDIEELLPVIYRTCDFDLIGRLKDDALYERLLKRLENQQL